MKKKGERGESVGGGVKGKKKEKRGRGTHRDSHHLSALQKKRKEEKKRK